MSEINESKLFRINVIINQLDTDTIPDDNEAEKISQVFKLLNEIMKNYEEESF